MFKSLKKISLVLASAIAINLPYQVQAHNITIRKLPSASLFRYKRTGFSHVGVASFYGLNDGYHGRKTASGVRFNTYSRMCAHRTARFGTRLRITNLKTGRSTVCQVTDRGPFVSGRIVDLSVASFRAIAPLSQGVVKVRVEQVE